MEYRDMSNQGWGPEYTNPPINQTPQPSEEPTDDKPPKQPIWKRKWFIPAAAAILVVVLTVIGLTTNGEKHTAQTSVTASASTEVTSPTSAPSDETFPEESIPESIEPFTANVGDAVTLSNTDSGEDVSKVAVTKVKFSSGDEFNKPDHGHFMGAYIKVRALADGQTSLWSDFYVVMNGHHY